MMPSNHLILWHPLLLLPSIFPSIMVLVFFDWSVLHKLTKAWVAWVLPMNIEHWFPLGSTGLISLLSKGLSKVFTSTTVQKNQSIGAQSSLWSNSHIHTWPLETIALTRQTFTCKAMSLLFNMLSRLVKAFLSRSKHPLISWLQSPFAVILESKKINLSLFPLFPHLFAMKLWDWMPWSLFFEARKPDTPLKSLVNGSYEKYDLLDIVRHLLIYSVI